MNTAHKIESLTSQLPQELVSQIFAFSIPPFASLAPEPDPSYSSTGTLSLVCNAWKDIALSTPQLWNSFAIQLHSPKFAFTLHRTETHLERSGSLPLAIQIDMAMNCPDAMFHPILDRLNVHSHRWHTLILCIPFSLTSRLVGDPSRGASRLDSLIIRPTRPTIPESRSASVAFGSRHTQFRPSTITMSGLYLNALNIDWSHLIDMNIVSLSVEECLQLLRLAPLLRHLKIRSILHNTQATASTQVQVTHYSLETWDLSTPSRLFSSLLWDQITLPKLTSLNLCDGPCDALGRLLKRSSCPLAYFGLYRGSTSGLVSLLSAMPHLKHLYLENLTSGGDEIATLCALMALTTAYPAHSDESTLFLPRLETVQYYRCPNLVWTTIPSWFPPTETKSNILYRPLSDIDIDVYVLPSEMENEAIDSDTVSKLLDLIGRGFDLTVNNDTYNADEIGEPTNFIEDSRRYHAYR